MQGEQQTETRTICDQLEDIIHESRGEGVTLRALLHSLQESGFGMLMIVLVLPNCVPIPVPPGTSTVFSIPLLFLALQMLAGRHELWIPEKLAVKEIKLSFLRKVVERIAPHLRRIERYVRPRLLFMTSSLGERVIAFCWLIFAISIAIPLPMTNFLPGVGILVSGFGLLYRDGAIVLAGMVIGAVGIVGTILILTIGSHIIQSLFFG